MRRLRRRPASVHDPLPTRAATREPAFRVPLRPISGPPLVPPKSGERGILLVASDGKYMRCIISGDSHDLTVDDREIADFLRTIGRRSYGEYKVYVTVDCVDEEGIIWVLARGSAL